MPKVETRDLSKANGRRIRIRFDEYDARARQFKPMKGLVILLNAADRPQIERLHRMVGDAALQLLKEDASKEAGG